MDICVVRMSVLESPAGEHLAAVRVGMVRSHHLDVDVGRSRVSQQPRTLDPSASPAAFFGAQVRALRERASLSQAKLGRLVHSSGDLIAKVEKAERRPSPDLVDRLDRALGAEGHLLRLAHEIPERADRSVRRTWEPGAGSGQEMAQALRDILDGIRQLDHGLGSGHALPALLAHARLAGSLLPGFSGLAERSVLDTLGEAHQLAGWMQFDNGQMPLAEASFVTAHAHAERSGNDALAAYVLGPSHGFASAYTGDPSAGAARCEEALTHAVRSGNHRLVAFVLAIGARAHAKLGERRTCLAMLDRAEGELARHASGSVDPVWLNVFDEAALRGHRGSCWLDLGEAGRAVSLLAAQEAAAPKLFARNRAIWLLDRARAHADLRQVEEACEAVQRALDVAAGTSSRRTLRCLRQTGELLAGWEDVSAVAAVRERLAVVLAA